MNRPGVIIIGTPRSGTTSLFYYLKEHPDILPCSIKETYFFYRYYNNGKEWYESHFPAGEEGQIALEATPFYFYYKYAAERIYETYGNDIKFIVLMRNPVERAYSHFKLNKKRWKSGDRMKHEPLEDFKDAVQMEPIRLKGKEPEAFEQFVYSYISKGRYSEQIERWFQIFKPENFLFIKSEDMFENTQDVYNATLKFLGLKKHTLKKILAYNSTDKSEIEPEFRKKLVSYFEAYNDTLYKMLNVDFKWK